MKIRKARPADINQWADMRNRLWPDSPDDHVREIKAYFSGQPIDIVQVYVLEGENGGLMGFIELNVRSYAEGSRSPEVPYVEAWYVRKSCRSQGLGKKLMQQAEQWAVAQGYAELASDTDIENNKSISIHKKLGFEETDRVVCFLKKLA